MNRDLESYLSELGFEIGTEGSKYFSTLLEEVLCLMNEGKRGKQIREELKELSKIYCYKYFKIKRSLFYNEMKKFVKNRLNPKQQKVTTETVHTTLIILGRRYLQKKEKENSAPKVYRKI